MRYIYKYIPEFLLAAYILIFFLFKNPGNNWERVINSDGKGYYAYLTAIFIYHDLNYKFVEQYEDKYYPPDKLVFKEFRIKTENGIVNKCFPGLAVVWLPFFLIAHFLSYLLGYEPDGYSLIYQYAIAVSALFYLWLGCRFLFKLLLKLKATEKQAGFITLLTGLGTNLIFYTIIEGSMTHVYSFALITLFLYSVLTLNKSGQGTWFVFSCFLFALIILIRPVNAMILLLVPFIASFAITQRVSGTGVPVPGPQFPLISTRHLVSGIVTLLFLLSIPMILWYTRTGHWIVYTYGEEGFAFTNPHFFSILFSYNRGWFVYTPIAFIAMAGIIGLYQENKKGFYWLLAFLFIFVYVTSSWWMWYYASKCGQRIFIDILVITGILLLFLFRWLKNQRILKTSLSIVLWFLLALNLLQSYQHYRWIFPSTEINREIYWNAFFSLHPEARVNIPDEAIISTITKSQDMEKGRNWMNEGTFSGLMAYSGKKSSLISARSPYSAGIATGLDTLFTSQNRVLRISAMVLSLGAKNGALAVADFGNNNKGQYYKAFFLEPFAIPFKWTRIEAAFYVPRDLGPAGTVKLYFFLPPGNDPFFIDDMSIDFLSLKEKVIYTKIDGVLIPTK